MGWMEQLGGQEDGYVSMRERERGRKRAKEYLNIHDNRDVGLSYLLSSTF